MKTLCLKLGDKIYTTGHIVARLSREALALQKDLISAAEIALRLQSIGDDPKPEEIAEIKEMLQIMGDIEIRKLNLICEVYGGKFTADEVENNLSREEISDEINRITNGIRGITEKN